MYTKHIPRIVKPLAKDLVFRLDNKANKIYLTFDDGPHSTITPWVLDELARVGAKATFFIVGDNIPDNEHIIQRIVAEGHALGNHSFNHLNGWKTTNEEYVSNVEACSSLIPSRLLRPPYGKITRSQVKALKEAYSIIMWSDLSADFDIKYSGEDCFEYATRKVRPGSIIVFHDSEKAEERLRKALPLALDYYVDKGFTMAPIPQEV